VIAHLAMLRRWLASGPNGERHGFTAMRLLHRDSRGAALAGIASGAFHPPLVPNTPPTDKPEFGGGRSGGAGASGEF